MIAHLALIMDGNRRWAKKRSMMPWLGHKQGVQTVEMAIQYCLDYKIKFLSLYTFSLENFKRCEQEVSYLFSLIDQAKDRVQEFIKAGVAIKFIGDDSKFPIKTKKICDEIESMTKSGNNLQCNFLMCYGSQQEIISTMQNIINKKISEVSIETFKENSWLGNIPDPEIIIRTGGIKRLSNFLLFQAAYSEIRFLDCLWPDLTKELLHQTVSECNDANKNFGK